MTKITLTLLLTGIISITNAASTNSTLSLNGSVNAVCTSNFSNGTLSFTLVPGASPTFPTTTYTLTCTAGTVITAFTAQSANTWKMIGATSGFEIQYGISGTTAAPYTNEIVTLWGAPSTPQQNNLLVNSSMTIDGSATQLVTALTAGMPQVASNAAVDTYSDTVTVVASY